MSICHVVGIAGNWFDCRMATHLENLGNLEMSGNLRVVRGKRKSQGKCSCIMVSYREY